MVESSDIYRLCAILQGVILAGVIMRVIWCALASMQNADDAPRNKTRIKNMLLFLIFAELALTFPTMMTSYYG
jgi:putative Ca2+/H+ antiporter (TMEM165/GDT1 family)